MISIITPVYNGEKFIESCITNVIDQSCPDVEHIIVDGGSTDGSAKIIEEYAVKYPHIRWISENDKGQSDAMNKGIGMAAGDILGFLNVDDFYEPGVLCRISEIFKTLPEPSLLVGNCNVWDNEGKLWGINKPERICLINHLSERFLELSFPVNPSAYFYHASLHRETGLYKVDEHYGMDLDFILRAVQVANVKYVNEIWGNMRYLEGTKTFSDNNSGKSSNRVKSIISSYRKRLPFPQQLKINLQCELFMNLGRIKYISNKLLSLYKGNAEKRIR